MNERVPPDDLYRLARSVPVLERHGRPALVRVCDVPQPHRAQLDAWLIGKSLMVIDGEACAWVQDWRSFLSELAGRRPLWF